MLDSLKGDVVPVKMWALTHEVESAALDQLLNVAALPVCVHHVAVMPDVHFGKGATVGSVIATKDAICPAAVGVDIGCGMMAGMTNLTASDLPDSLKAVRSQVERDIPVGFNWHDDPRRAQREIGLKNRNAIDKLWKEFSTLDKSVHNLQGKADKQLGTLGGGNHFIELCLDTEQRVWLMLHSGSRNIGKELAGKHINVAKELEHNQRMQDRDLAYFLAGTPEMKAYRNDLYWAQQYAMLNREVMFANYVAALKRFFPHLELKEKTISCHHNYVSEERHFDDDVFITRKGAISAKSGELGIIPGSMGTRSYIVSGLGNPESFNSASHGAGRKMSRGQAKRSFTTADLESQTAGVECRKTDDVLDEIPGAYKDIDRVMESQKDLVKVMHVLKQVMCIKG